MKKIVFLLMFLIVTFTFSEKISKEKLPKEVKYSGDFKEAVSFSDSLGNHILVTSELEILQKEEDRSSYIFVYDYLKKKNGYLLNWKLEDGVTDCPVDYFAKFLESPLITDLNKNGIKEVTMVYSLTCRGDVSADELKVIMRENNNKYGLRGYTVDPINGENGVKPCCILEEELYPMDMYGKYENENDFKKAPKNFLEYAKNLWIKYRAENVIKLEE